jgi:hypothetical protein
MYEFHYEYIRPKYGNKAKLLLTDTDSLCYHIQTEDAYEDMRSNSHLFDTSNYDPKHELFDTKNKQVLGKMKDEMGGIPIQEFVGLKSKMYSMKTPESDTSKAKGIARSYVKRHLSHENYKKALSATSLLKGSWVKIGSTDHQLATVKVSKSLLSPYDDKRYILSNGIDTLAIGHQETGKWLEYEDNFDSDVDVISDEEKEERIDTEAKTKENAKLVKAKYEEISDADMRRKAKLENRRKKQQNQIEWEKDRKKKQKQIKREKYASLPHESKKRIVEQHQTRLAAMSEEKKREMKKLKTEKDKLREKSMSPEKKQEMRKRKTELEKLRKANMTAEEKQRNRDRRAETQRVRRAKLHIST